MKLVHVTLFHQRPEVSELWLHHMRGKMVAACVTEGDHSNIALLQAAGVPYVTAPNQPLGAKANAAHRLAMTLGAKAYMWLPCDDFISPQWSARAYRWITRGTSHYVLPARCGMHEPWTNRSCTLSQLNGVLGCGAGRMWSDEVARRVGDMWAPHAPKGLDYRSHQRITGLGYKAEYLDAVPVPIVDVKCSRNIWKFDDWVRKGHHAKADDVLWMLSPEERAIVATFTGRK